jgi:putative transposase
VRKIFGISRRRVSQIWAHYVQFGEPPELQKPGRKRVRIPEDETRLVLQAHSQMRCCAAYLEKHIKATYGYSIGHNRIHKILRSQNLVNTGVYMPRKKTWIRYERRHSLTAVHVDWHQRSQDGPWVIIVEDDASRAILSMIETDSPTVETTIYAMELALKHGKIQQVITDHGSQFWHRNAKEHTFAVFLKKHGIKHILCRIKHPQSNGKIEKLFHCYECKRDLFATGDDFVHWYNYIKPHASLNLEACETPMQAFIRKQRKEELS